MSLLQQIKQALLAHYTAPPRLILQRFRNGVICFALGLVVIFMANTQLKPSLAQEVVVLAGLILAGIGFIAALLAEMRFLIGRIIAFVRKK